MRISLSNESKIRFLRSFFIILIFIIPLSNIARGLYNLVNANDFAIYQQAIYNIATGISWNPFLTIRSAAIFNDHADPIIYLGALFVKIFGFHQNRLYIFEWLWFVATLLFLRQITLSEKKEHDFTHDYLIYVLPFFLFSRSLLQGLEFPIHPTTWSMFPILLLFFFLKKENFKALFLISFLTSLFRESLPFSILALSFYYLLKRQHKRFFSLFLLSLSFIILFTFARPYYLGPVVNYGQSLMKELFHHPFSLTWSRFLTFKFPIKELTPPLILFASYLYFLIKEKKRDQLIESTAVLFFISPILYLHMISNYMVHHHTIPVVVPLMTIPLLSNHFRDFLKRKKILFIVLLSLFISTASSRYTKMVRVLLIPPYHSTILKDRYLALQNILQQVKNINIEKKIMASGGIIPAIMEPGRPIYQFVEITPKDLIVDYLLLELNYHGDLNPLTASDIETIKNRCLPLSKSIIYQDQFFILMEGPFDDSCLGIKQRWPYTSPYLPI